MNGHDFPIKTMIPGFGRTVMSWFDFLELSFAEGASVENVRSKDGAILMKKSNSEAWRKDGEISQSSCEPS